MAALASNSNLARGEKPIATCNLQTFNVQATSAMISAGGLLSSQPALDDSLSYKRGPSGEWLVPKQVAANDPLIRTLLLAPGEPVRIDWHVRIAGKSFRAQHEQWIDEALSNPEPKAKEAEADEKEKSPTPTAAPAAGMGPRAFLGLTPKAWLQEYVASSSGTVDRYHARWMLAQRAGGPSLLELQRFSTSRSSSTPMVRFIDSDGDGTLSKAEIDSIESRMVASDVNQDATISADELARSPSSSKTSKYRVWRVEPLLVVLEDETDWSRLKYLLKTKYDGDQTATFAKKDLSELLETKPAMVIEVNFRTTDDQPQVALAKVGNNLPARGTEDSIVISHGAVAIEVAAGTPSSATKTSQVSIGAVAEGSPLWNAIDTNRDGAISIRERASVRSQVLRFDTNSDGVLTGDEIPTRLRLAVALGGEVHEMLKSYRLPPPPSESDKPAEAPTWFTSMDANGDGDLSATEFLGNKEQFSKYDTNGDGLISSREAAEVSP